MRRLRQDSEPAPAALADPEHLQVHVGGGEGVPFGEVVAYFLRQYAGVVPDVAAHFTGEVEVLTSVERSPIGVRSPRSVGVWRAEPMSAKRFRARSTVARSMSGSRLRALSVICPAVNCPPPEHIIAQIVRRRSVNCWFWALRKSPRSPYLTPLTMGTWYWAFGYLRGGGRDILSGRTGGFRRRWRPIFAHAEAAHITAPGLLNTPVTQPGRRHRKRAGSGAPDVRGTWGSAGDVRPLLLLQSTANAEPVTDMRTWTQPSVSLWNFL